MREVSWRREQTASYWLQVLLTIAALLSHSDWASQPWVTNGPKPSIYRWLSNQHLVPNWLQLELELTDSSRLWPLVIWLSYVHQLPVGVRICHHHRIQPRPQVKVIFWHLQPDAPVSLFFRLFTQVYLLIDGSVEGQNVTKSQSFNRLKLFFIQSFRFYKIGLLYEGYRTQSVVLFTNFGWWDTAS